MLDCTLAVVSITSTGGILGADCRVTSLIINLPASTGSSNTSSSRLILRSKSKAVRLGDTTSSLKMMGNADKASKELRTDSTATTGLPLTSSMKSLENLGKHVD